MEDHAAADPVHGDRSLGAEYAVGQSLQKLVESVVVKFDIGGEGNREHGAVIHVALMMMMRANRGNLMRGNIEQ